jgi:hypothetical protein
MNQLESESIFLPEGFCIGCVFVTHHQSPFVSGKSWKEHNLSKLVHSVLCCINLPSLAGAMYILNFIDDLSHFTWVYSLKKKILSMKSSSNLESLLKGNLANPSSAQD